MEDFHPELKFAASLIPRISFSPFSIRLIQGFQRLSGRGRIPIVSGITIEDIYVTASDGVSIRSRMYTPTSAKGRRHPVLLWIHGGGYLVGNPEQDEKNNISIAMELGITIVAVDYRLAPQHTFPTPSEDCYSVLQWIHNEAEKFDFDREKIVVGGASAGGGLAAALALMARDRNEVHVAMQLLIYPMLDDRTARRGDIDSSKFRLWSAESNRLGWNSYLGGAAGDEGISPYAAPARSVSMEGLPPAWIGVGTFDVLYDEDVTYAARLVDAGVNCKLEVVPGAFHGFDFVNRNTLVARTFRQSYIDAIREIIK